MTSSSLIPRVNAGVSQKEGVECVAKSQKKEAYRSSWQEPPNEAVGKRSAEQS